MVRMILRRLLSLVPVLFVVSVAVFGLVTLVPGDPAVTLAGGPDATAESIAQVRDQLGLDDPLVVQYWHWITGAIRLDFGRSLQSQRPVFDEMVDKIPVTIALTAAALTFAIGVSLVAGLITGIRPGGASDRVILVLTSLGVAVPGYWLGMVLIKVFAIDRSWFPALGFVDFSEDVWEWVRHLVLPGLALGSLAAASQTRQLRGALLDVMDSTYIRTAWSKGGSPRRVIGKHALKNAAIPAVTVIGLQTGALLGSAVIIEQIFSIPGMGSYMVRAILSKDLPVIQAVTVWFVLINVVINLLVDISYGYFNPRVRVR